MTDKKKQRVDPVGIVFSLGICSVLGYTAYLNYRPDHEHLANKLRQEGFVAAKHGDAQTSSERYEEAAHEAALGSVPLQLPGILIDLADTYVQLGDRRKAVAVLSKAIAVYDGLESSDDTMGSDTKEVLRRKRLRALVTLARLQSRTNKLDGAKASYKRALTYVSTISDFRESELKKEYLAVLTTPEDAVEAGNLVRQMEASSGTEVDLFNIIKRGADGIAGGDLPVAVKDLEQALRLARELDNQEKIAECLILLGIARTVCGQLDSAKTALEEAAALHNQTRSDALQLLSYQVNASGDRAGSDKLFDEAVRENLESAVHVQRLFLLISAFRNHNNRDGAASVAKFCLRHHTRLLANAEANKAPLYTALATESALAGEPDAGVTYWQSLSKLLGKPQDLSWLDVSQLTGIADAFTYKKESEKAAKYWRLAMTKLDKDPSRLTSYARQLAYQIASSKRAPSEYGEVVNLMYKAWRYMPVPLNYPLGMMKQDVDLIENAYRLMGVAPERTKIFSTALTYVEKWNAPEIVAYTLEQLGKCYVTERRFDEAIPLLERSIAIKKSLNATSDDLVDSQMHIISCCFNLGNYDRLRTYADKCLEGEYKDRNKEKRMRSCCYLHLGAALDKEGKTTEAEAMYAKARRYADIRVCGSMVGTIAGALDDKRKEALLINQISLFEKEKVEPSLEQGVLCTLLADQYNGEKRYEEAERYYQLALNCFKPFEKTEGGMHFLQIWNDHHACLLARKAGPEKRDPSKDE